MNEVFNHIFYSAKISSTCTQEMLSLDYLNLQEKGNVSTLYIIARGHWFPVCGLGNKCA